MARLIRPRAAVLCLLWAIAPAGLAQTVIRRGSEFQVNTYTPQGQKYASVSLDDAGNFVVVWASDGSQDGSSHGVFGRRFSAAGVALATEFQISTYTSSEQTFPKVSLDADGDFVAVWQSQAQDGFDGGIFARRFSKTGVAQAAEFQVNTYTSGIQYYAAIALDADGDFVVVWNSQQDGASYGIFGQRFNSAGAAQAVEFQVNASTAGGQFRPAVAVAEQGEFVVAWEGGAAGSEIYARAFSSAGAPQTGDIQVNDHTAGTQKGAAVGLDADRDFVVAWTSDYDSQVFARRFTSAGLPQGGDLVIAGSERYASIDVDDAGDFVVAWSASNGSYRDIFAQRFSADGLPQTPVFEVNTYTPQNQFRPAVSLDAGGDFVVAWESYHDGSSRGVFAQRYATLSLLDIDGDGTRAPLTDGLLVLRHLFGFTGATLVDGAVNLSGCTRCDAAAISAYLQGK